MPRKYLNNETHSKTVNDEVYQSPKAKTAVITVYCGTQSRKLQADHDNLLAVLLGEDREVGLQRDVLVTRGAPPRARGAWTKSGTQKNRVVTI